MAQKKGLIYRLTMGKDNLPDFTPNKLPGSRWAVFKDVFANRLGALVKLNLLVLLFCIPAIIWVVIVQMMKSVDNTLVPYSGNMGFGYNVVLDAVKLGQQRAFSFDMQMFLVLIPLIMIAGVGLSGAFYVMKRLSWGEGISVGSHFFKGIKMNFAPFLWSSLFVGVSLFLVMFNLGVYDVMVVSTVWKVIGIAVSIIQFVLILCMMIFLTTQAVTYKLKLWGLIKNSFLFAIALLPQNLFFLVLSAIPVILMLILPQIVAVIGYIIFALLGFSYIILVWTCYAHYAFDRFINDKVEGAEKYKGLYKKSAEDDKAKKEEYYKTNNIRFNNPLKVREISSIDEGSSYTPLSPTFSRQDLIKLEEEKQVVKQEIDSEFELSLVSDEELVRQEEEQRKEEEKRIKQEEKARRDQAEAAKRKAEFEAKGDNGDIEFENKPAVKPKLKFNQKKKK